MSGGGLTGRVQSPQFSYTPENPLWVAHAYNPSRQEDSKNQAILIYIESSRPAQGARDPGSTQINKLINNKKIKKRNKRNQVTERSSSLYVPSNKNFNKPTRLSNFLN